MPVTSPLSRRMVLKLARLVQTIAGYSLLILSASCFPHENKVHDNPQAARKEQQAWGIAGDAKSVKRTITLSMSDTMRFTPDHLQVKQGETIRLVIRNTGQVLHELVLGTQQVLDEHAALMLKFPAMEHDEPYMAHVPPGKTGQIIWTFNRAGEFDFACLIPGHYQAGMRGKISVTAAP
jgi:uncharacterized cupredoxin-like copper-binding protein